MKISKFIKLQAGDLIRVNCLKSLYNKYDYNGLLVTDAGRLVSLVNHEHHAEEFLVVAELFHKERDTYVRAVTIKGLVLELLRHEIN